MKQLARALGVAVLIAASLNASAGLCFCHWGPAAPGSPPVSHGCCHGPDLRGPVALTAVASCCHIEAAEHQAAPEAAAQFAPPAERVELADAPSFTAIDSPTARVLPADSPPLFALRI